MVPLGAVAPRPARAGPGGIGGAGSGATSNDAGRVGRLPSAWFDFIKHRYSGISNCYLIVDY